MAHPLVEQLRFTRLGFRRGFDGLSAEDAVRRLTPMNSLGWLVGHLAWTEQQNFLRRASGITIRPELDDCGVGRPASTPPIDEMWAAWDVVTAAAEPFLDVITIDQLEHPLERDERTAAPTLGTAIQRAIYHYWAHAGESSAIRQLLGHGDFPQFLGPADLQPPYRREAD